MVVEIAKPMINTKPTHLGQRTKNRINTKTNKAKLHLGISQQKCRKTKDKKIVLKEARWDRGNKILSYKELI